MSEEITSVDNPFVKHCVKLRTSARYRREQGEVLLVGRKAVAEAKDLSLAIVTEESLQGVENRVVAPHVMRKITGVEAPDGVAALVKRPEWELPATFRRLLILDGVSDPGNMGTLLRTALALGWEGAILVGDCVDPFNDKALRAAKGAPLRFPTWTLSWAEVEQLLSDHELTKVVADLDGEQPSKIEGAVALVLGNEGQGPSEQALSAAQKITIPMSGKMESLNVAIAGGILMHQLGELS